MGGIAGHGATACHGGEDLGGGGGTPRQDTRCEGMVAADPPFSWRRPRSLLRLHSRLRSRLRSQFRSLLRRGARCQPRFPFRGGLRLRLYDRLREVPPVRLHRSLPHFLSMLALRLALPPFFRLRLRLRFRLRDRLRLLLLVLLLLRSRMAPRSQLLLCLRLELLFALRSVASSLGPALEAGFAASLLCSDTLPPVAGFAVSFLTSRSLPPRAGNATSFWASGSLSPMAGFATSFSCSDTLPQPALAPRAVAS
mmetsp:Transcript_103880/g.292986  ORF Transcript_103880/g.292986 Transcript_103880/m.292986 type:complete len:253 (-) Transcript_103880:1954-2712(-)